MSNYVKNIGGISLLGQVFTQINKQYESLMKPAGGKKSPPYVADLMGEYTVPSMFLKLPVDSPPESPVNAKKKPFHIASVINLHHLQLMGLLKNITLKTEVPVQAVAEQINRPEVADYLAAKRAELAYSIKVQQGVDPGQPLPPVDNRIFTPVVDGILGKCAPTMLPEITFELKDVKTNEVLPVTIPNILTEVNDPFVLSSGKRPVPLALIGWGLTEAAKGNLLTHPAALLIHFFVGTQQGLTTNMAALLSKIEEQLPSGKTLDDYLVKNEPMLVGCIQKEAHHLQIWRVMQKAFMEQTMYLSHMLRSANVDPDAVSLKEYPQHAARDTACLLYATAAGFGRLHKINEIGVGLERMSGRNTSMEVMIKGLEDLAEKVSQCADIDEVTQCLKQSAHFAVLRDAARRAMMIYENNEIGVQGEDGQPAPIDIGAGLRLIQRDILPELQRGEEPYRPR